MLRRDLFKGLVGTALAGVPLKASKAADKKRRKKKKCEFCGDEGIAVEEWRDGVLIERIKRYKGGEGHAFSKGEDRTFVRCICRAGAKTDPFRIQRENRDLDRFVKESEAYWERRERLIAENPDFGKPCQFCSGSGITNEAPYIARDAADLHNEYYCVCDAGKKLLAIDQANRPADCNSDLVVASLNHTHYFRRNKA